MIKSIDQIKYDQIIYKQHIITNQVLYALFAETKNIGKEITDAIEDTVKGSLENKLESSLEDINSKIEKTLEGAVSGILIMIMTGFCSSDDLQAWV